MLAQRTHFYHLSNYFFLVFYIDSIEVKLEKLTPDDEYEVTKYVRTKQWFEIPASPYAVRILIANGIYHRIYHLNLQTSSKYFNFADNGNTHLNISNIRGDPILSLNFCATITELNIVYFKGPKLYFNCIHSYNDVDGGLTIRERSTKSADSDGDGYVEVGIAYDEVGYNFTKTWLDTSHYAKEPLLLYDLKIGNSTKDWCEGDPQPKLIVPSENGTPLEKSNKAILSELQKFSGQIDIAQTKAASTNDAILSELQQIKEAIDKLVSHSEEIAVTSVN